MSIPKYNASSSFDHSSDQNEGTDFTCGCDVVSIRNSSHTATSDSAANCTCSEQLSRARTKMLLHQLPEVCRLDGEHRHTRRKVSTEAGRRWSTEGSHTRRQSTRGSWFRSTSLRSESVGEENDEISYGKLPTIKKRIHADNIFKFCQEDWQHRYVCCTEDDLLIALPGSCEISDRVPLHEIKSVTKVRNDASDILSKKSDVHAFNVHTIEDGYNCGREYCFGLQDSVQLEEWYQVVSKLSKRAAKRVANRTAFETFRNRAVKLANSNIWKRFNSTMVAANLVVIVAQSQILPTEGSITMAMFDCLDIAFTAIFTVELLVHIFAYWLRPFISDGWLLFDFFVVTISLSALIFRNLPGVPILRLMRTFRVLRLFNRFRSLKTLINALAASLIPVLNAFVMVLLVCVVYAILGVELFNNNKPEYFGNFILSYWTMFQISTSDGWSEKARQLSESSPNDVDPIVACFMSSFIVVVTWVLLPVVVAVLLDNFIRAVATENVKASKEQESDAMNAMRCSKADFANPLDPVLETLSRFNSSEDLTRRIGTLFQVLDVDVCGMLDFRMIQEGLKKMDSLKSRIHLSSDDYNRMTHNGSFCNKNGRMDRKQFHQMLCHEIDRFINCKVANAYDDSLVDERSDTAAILAALKVLLQRTRSRPTDLQHDQAPECENANISNTLRVILDELKVLKSKIEETNSKVTYVNEMLSNRCLDVCKCHDVYCSQEQSSSQALKVGINTSDRKGIAPAKRHCCCESALQFEGNFQLSGVTCSVVKTCGETPSDEAKQACQPKLQKPPEFDEISCVNPPISPKSSQNSKMENEAGKLELYSPPKCHMRLAKRTSIACEIVESTDKLLGAHKRQNAVSDPAHRTGHNQGLYEDSRSGSDSNNRHSARIGNDTRQIAKESTKRPAEVITSSEIVLVTCSE